MRYWICDISGSDAERRFEMDFKEPPNEGSVIAPGIVVYKVSGDRPFAQRDFAGVIEVERVTEPQPIPAEDWPSYRPGAYPH